jgi:Cyclic nucleotide-binding domain
MQQGYAELKTGLEHRHRLHVVRANLSDAEFVNGADPQFAMRSLLALRGGLAHYPCNKMICIEGDPAEYIFLLVDGVVRTCRSFEDGNRSIVCFHVPGELFGFDGELTHSPSAEAATSTSAHLLSAAPCLPWRLEIVELRIFSRPIRQKSFGACKSMLC